MAAGSPCFAGYRRGNAAANGAAAPGRIDCVRAAVSTTQWPEGSAALPRGRCLGDAWNVGVNFSRSPDVEIDST
jgi:hypothetical protein